MKMLITLFLLLASVSIKAQDIAGVWLTQDKDAQVEIYKTGNGDLDGKIVWVKDNTPEAKKAIGNCKSPLFPTA